MLLMALPAAAETCTEPPLFPIRFANIALDPRGRRFAMGARAQPLQRSAAPAPLGAYRNLSCMMDNAPDRGREHGLGFKQREDLRQLHG